MTGPIRRSTPQVTRSALTAPMRAGPTARRAHVCRVGHRRARARAGPCSGGHLNLVDLGVGGYRTIAPDARPLSCEDLHEGDEVETNGRGVHRSGTIVSVAPYTHETETIFPCMAVTDLEAAIGDSGGAVMLDGQPAGIAARQFEGKLGFTRWRRGSPTSA